MRHIARGGAYLRVADPLWTDPLDPRYARAAGGRWNPPGSFGVIYLNRSEEVARANVLRRLEGQPYGPEDFAPGAGPLLVEVVVGETTLVDAVSARGLRTLGLPASYPADPSGAEVSRSVCQPIGAEAWGSGEAGIACRSAALKAPARGEELALFDRGRRPARKNTYDFEEWFWPSTPA
jgi:RES domain-containing protein